MKKSLLIALGCVALGFIGFVALNSYIYQEKQADGAPDEKNATYLIEGAPVTLVNGTAETATEGSAITTLTQYFGNALRTDLNADGREDVVFLLTQQGGGSGTFFYVVPALNTANGYVGGTAFFIGDRIAPQNINLDEDGTTIIVNYADRKPDEPFTADPSVGVSVWLALDKANNAFIKTK